MRWARAPPRASTPTRPCSREAIHDHAFSANAFTLADSADDGADGRVAAGRQDHAELATPVAAGFDHATHLSGVAPAARSARRTHWRGAGSGWRGHAVVSAQSARGARH